MKRIRVLRSFSANGISFYPGMEIELNEELAVDFQNAKLVEILGEIQEKKGKKIQVTAE